MLTDLMAAIAQRIERIDGIAGASYPAINHVPASPWVMVRVSDEPTRYEKRRMGAQVVTAFIDVIVLVASSRETPRDQNRLDGIPEVILDTFDASLTGGSAAELVPDLVLPTGTDLNRIWRDAVVQRATATWGTQFCYAAILRLDPTFERSPAQERTA